MAVDSTTRTRGGFRPRWWMTCAFAVLVAVGALTSTRLTVSASVNLTQCNGGDGGGSNIACDVTIVNNLYGGVTSSTVTVARYCAGTNVNCFPTPGTTTSSTQLVTDVHQCNNAGNGGGSSLTCTVRITNNLTSGAGVTPTTVNECVGSADGIGGASVTCNPFPATTSGADVTQCDGSANGGTLVGLSCSVSPGSTKAAALPVTVNQCNGADNGGGSKVICRVFITNNISAPGSTPPGSTPPGTTPPGGTPPGSTPPGSTPPGSSPPGVGQTPGSGITTAEQPPMIGAPPTGAAASQGGGSLGLLALLGGLVVGFVIRARRTRMSAR